MKISKKNLKRVKKLDLLSYFKNYEPDELIPMRNGTYRTRTHSSLKLSNGKWCWWREKIGGISALDYFVNVEGWDFLQAALHLLNLIDGKKPELIVNKQQDNKCEFKLPRKNEDCSRLKEYLIKERCLDSEIVDYCLENKLIYECKTDHSVVFIGYDSHRLASYACKRATDDDWKIDVAGSNKRFSFSMTNSSSKTLRVFESAIDLLSFMTLMKRSGRDYKADNYLSIAGATLIGRSIEETKIPVALEQFLSDYPIEKIILHLDDDRAGIETTRKIYYWLHDNYEVKNQPPRNAKDFNEMLQLRTNKKKEILER